jgi:tetratricopeptide (TPR) repeat protein
VFAGGCTLEAAEDVCAGGDVGADAVLDLLALLVAKSLVVTDRDPGGARYRLLEMIRQYAREKLVTAGDHERLRTRQRDWCLALVGRAEREVWGADQATWLDRLEAENDNLRQALDFTIAAGDAETALRFVGALGRFWMVRGGWDEGQRFLLDALALPGTANYPFLRAQALNTAALMTFGSTRDDVGTAERLASEALAIYRELGTRRGIFWALQTLAFTAIRRGDLAAAESLADEAITVARSAAHEPSIAYALHQRAAVAFHRGDYSAAEASAAEALPMMRRAGDMSGVVTAIALRGTAVAGQRRFPMAAPIFQEALDLYRQLGNRESAQTMLVILGSLALVTDEPVTARRDFEDAYAIARDAGDRYGEMLASAGLGEEALAEPDLARAVRWYTEATRIFTATEVVAPGAVAPGALAPVLAGLGKVAAADESYERAACLFGAAERTREDDHTRHFLLRWLLYEHRYDQHLDLVRNALGESAFASAFAHGRAMSTQAAIAYALEGDTSQQ